MCIKSHLCTIQSCHAEIFLIDEYLRTACSCLSILSKRSPSLLEGPNGRDSCWNGYLFTGDDSGKLTIYLLLCTKFSINLILDIITVSDRVLRIKTYLSAFHLYLYRSFIQLIDKYRNVSTYSRYIFSGKLKSDTIFCRWRKVFNRLILHRLSLWSVTWKIYIRRFFKKFSVSPWFRFVVHLSLLCGTSLAQKLKSKSELVFLVW